MAKWTYTVMQKRILTRIISSLQKEISGLEKGGDLNNLVNIMAVGDLIPLEVPMSSLVKRANNYHEVKKAFFNLKDIPGGILLPPIKGKKGMPEPELYLPGFISDVCVSENARVIRFHLSRQSFSELVKPYNGLTSVSEEVLFRTDSHYSQRIYELICQWKDKEVFTMSIERFREFMGLGQKYHTSNALINGVIKPAERDLDAIADVFFRFSSSKAGTRITHLNFAIKHRKSVKQECEMNLRIRDQVVNILRIRFGFREEHFKVIARLLADDSMLRLLNQKVGELWTILDQRSCDIRNVPAWALAAITDKFDPKRENEAVLQIGYETT